MYRSLVFISVFFVNLAANSTLSATSVDKVTIVPHRAYYTVSLKSAKTDSSVEDTNGKMVLELNHDCSGWTLKQDSASVIEMKGSSSEAVRSNYTAWESEDGRTLRFEAERIFNETIQDQVGGIAGFTPKGGNITYTSPETRKISMAPGTLPPITHMKRLIEAAASGQGNASGQVFDGSFFGNPVQINAFIGPKKQACSVDVQSQTVWPMSLAVYSLPSAEANPNFEITQNIASNGVMCAYTINFGDYTVIGRLDKVVFLKEKVCKK